MIADMLLKEWRWLEPFVPPTLRQWLERTVGAIFDSPQPAPVLRQQLERELQQKSQTQTILNDPSLTVEDKVALMMALIVKKMDADIEKQAAAVHAMGSATGPRPVDAPRPSIPAGAGTKTPIPAKNGPSSIDVETLKLKRMIDKRSRTFDMLRQMMERYNDAAKSVLEALR